MTTIEELMKEYSRWMSQANHLEMQYKEALQNAESVQRVIKLMKNRSNIPEDKKDSSATLIPSGKYSDMNMPSAIFDILKKETNLSTDEIYQRLIANGFQSKSKTLKRDVATRLYNLKKDGSVDCIEQDKLYRYFLASEKPTRSRRTRA
jgi:hypothetical protein